MKVKLYVHEDKMEAKFSDGSSVRAKGTEAKEVFLARVDKIVTNDFLVDDYEVVEVTKEVMSTNDDATLLEASLTATGLQKKMILEVLKERKVIGANRTRVNVVPQTYDEIKATEEYADAKSKVGKFVTFTPHKQEVVIEGKITGIVPNKTNTKLYFNIQCEDKTRTCVAVLNETVTFIETPAWGIKPEKTKKVKKTEATAAVEGETVEGSTEQPKKSKAKKETVAEEAMA